MGLCNPWGLYASLQSGCRVLAPSSNNITRPWWETKPHITLSSRGYPHPCAAPLLLLVLFRQLTAFVKLISRLNTISQRGTVMTEGLESAHSSCSSQEMQLWTFSGGGEKQTPTSGIPCKGCNPWAHGCGKAASTLSPPSNAASCHHLTFCSTHLLPCAPEMPAARPEDPSQAKAAAPWLMSACWGWGSQLMNPRNPGSSDRKETHISWHTQALHWGFLAYNFRLKFVLY